MANNETGVEHDNRSLGPDRDYMILVNRKKYRDDMAELEQLREFFEKAERPCPTGTCDI